MPGTRFSIEVQPLVPAKLARLNDLANNLFYAWTVRVSHLFEELDPKLWNDCSHNPKVFMRRVSQVRLEEAANDRLFVEDYHRALSIFDTYLNEAGQTPALEYLKHDKDLVAYFCAEFGLHESLPIYSGGLGILAGDHCKAASDLNIPFVAIGLLYRQGYFTQTIDAHGNQLAHFTPSNFNDLAIEPVRNEAGDELRIKIPIQQRTVEIKVWRAKVGHIFLYLLDTDIAQNSAEDRSITYQLYGGDEHTRIQQEIVLSVGGVRTLRALGLSPNVWHINEGHAAFLVLERCRELVKQNLDFSTALEISATSTVFTTHTPVPAGHDVFSDEMIRDYLQQVLKELDVPATEILKLGKSGDNSGHFNMTTLALKGSRFHNGVSRIHGNVASAMEQKIWPQILPAENPIQSITNGVHLPTFMAREWSVLFDLRFGNSWRDELLNEDYWQCLDDIPLHNFWNVRLSLKTELLQEVCKRASIQYRRNQYSELQIEKLVQCLSGDISNTLVIGFARRFATYKRATLLFSDPKRLSALLNRSDKKVLLLFAGKAHPNDMPGQHLIKVIHDFSRQPQFEGSIVLLEDYDLALARHLVAGVDVWLNTPEYPLEASGTSGEKAGINGVLNLSILDGWWAEGFSGDNGWGITPHGPQYDNAYRNQQEATQLLDLLEQQVIPTYFERDSHGFSENWIKKSKAAMKKIIPGFNAQRMVMDYVRLCYGPAARQESRIRQNNYEAGITLARWKQKIHKHWSGVTIQQVGSTPATIIANEKLLIRVQVALAGLQPEDVVVECLFGRENETGQFIVDSSNRFTNHGQSDGKQTLFELTITPPLSGLQNFNIRIFPSHALLTHPFETGYMIWL